MQIFRQQAFSLAIPATIVLVFFITFTSPAFGQAMGGMGMGGMGGMGMGGMGGMDMGMAAPMSPLEKLKQSLWEAKTDGARQTILTKIKTMLSSQYDSYLAQNENELQQMENRVKNLRAQLERRKDAKSQLLKLELQRIANEAAGLVWPEEPSGMRRMGMDGMGGMGMGGMGMGGMGMGGMGMGGMGAADMGMVDPFSEDGLNKDETPEAEDTETMNQLRQITLAALNFVSGNMRFPGNIGNEDGKPMLSWRVAILPYLDGEGEGQALHDKFKLDEPWNSEHNLELLDQMPDVFKSASFDSQTKTVFLGFEGKGTMFETGKKLGFGSIADGSSNTAFVALMNRQSAVPWTKPADVKFAPGTPVTQLAETADGSIIISCCDGSVTSIKLEKIDAKNLENLIQRNDGNVVSIDQ